jgi:hypothetical protein
MDYKNGKIYKIVDKTNGNMYIGSTCQKTLAQRFSQHKSNYRLKNRVYTSSFEIIKNGNCEIVLIENYPCDNKDELHARERYYIEISNCVNKVIPIKNIKNYNDFKVSVTSELDKRIVDEPIYVASGFKILKDSSFDKDFQNYKILLQSALNKKILKWNNLVKQSLKLDEFQRKFSLQKLLTIKSNLIWTKHLFYLQLNLIVVNNFYEIRKEVSEMKAKEIADEYMKKKHFCKCGGSYTNRNKQVHLQTNKHKAYFLENDE